MTKKEKVTAAKAIVMLAELANTTKHDYIKAEALRLIEELAEAIESKTKGPHKGGPILTNYHNDTHRSNRKSAPATIHRKRGRSMARHDRHE